MVYALMIEGRLSGGNDYIAANRSNPYVGAKLKKQMQSSVEIAIRSQLAGVKIENPVHIDYTFYEPNMRRDLDNVFIGAAKVIQDALVKCGVLFNDGWRYVTGFSADFKLDRDHPHILVVISEVM